MTLTGKDALELHEQIKREAEQRRAEALARAKADAAARGKEPFDLDRLAALTALDALGRATPEERRASLEYDYYVRAKDALTLADFAAQLDERGRW